MLGLTDQRYRCLEAGLGGSGQRELERAVLCLEEGGWWVTGTTLPMFEEKCIYRSCHIQLVILHVQSSRVELYRQ